MTGFGIIAMAFLMWAWWCPHDFGQWLERVKDPYRQKPIHKKGAE